MKILPIVLKVKVKTQWNSLVIRSALFFSTHLGTDQRRNYNKRICRDILGKISIFQKPASSCNDSTSECSCTLSLLVSLITFFSRFSCPFLSWLHTFPSSLISLDTFCGRIWFAQLEVTLFSLTSHTCFIPVIFLSDWLLNSFPQGQLPSYSNLSHNDFHQLIIHSSLYFSHPIPFQSRCLLNPLNYDTPHPPSPSSPSLHFPSYKICPTRTFFWDNQSNWEFLLQSMYSLYLHQYARSILAPW